jgi:hypothetical protein
MYTQFSIKTSSSLLPTGLMFETPNIDPPDNTNPTPPPPEPPPEEPDPEEQ